MPGDAQTFSTWLSDPRLLPAYITALVAGVAFIYNAVKHAQTAERSELREEFVADYVDPVVKLLDDAQSACNHMLRKDPNDPKRGNILKKLDLVRERKLLATLNHVDLICAAAGAEYGLLLRKTIQVLWWRDVILPHPVHLDRQADLTELFEAVLVASGDWRRLFVMPTPVQQDVIDAARQRLDAAVFAYNRHSRRYLHDLCVRIVLRRPKDELTR